MDVELTLYDSTRIKCRFYSDLSIEDINNLRSGFKELNENNLKVQGDFSKMKYIYRRLDDKTVIFTSDENDIYIEPEKIEENTPANETAKTNPDVNAPTIEESKYLKILELSSICNSSIINGVDIIIDEKYEHFSYKNEDQANIKELFDIAIASNAPIYYHADGMGCKLYSVDEITELYTKAMLNKTHHMTYFNQIKMYVETLDDIEKINEMFYGQELTGKYLEVYNDVMKQTKENINLMIHKNVASESVEKIAD